MKYFYIIQRDRSITEVPYSDDSMQTALETWMRGGIILLESRNTGKPKGINAVDVSFIYDMVEYKNWCFQTCPKVYVKDGVWYDGKEHKVVRIEPWKQKENNARARLSNGEENKEPTPEEKQKAQNALNRIKLAMTAKGILPKAI